MVDLSSIALWLVIGCICLLLEFAKLPGIGFLFLGLGALTNAILVYTYPALLDYYQYASFGLISFLWLAILWLPLRTYFYKKKNKSLNYSDMIDQEVEVYNKISIGAIGQVKWSGTIMNAKLLYAEKDPAEIGDKLYIKQVHGNVLICSKDL